MSFQFYDPLNKTFVPPPTNGSGSIPRGKKSGYTQSKSKKQHATVLAGKTQNPPLSDVEMDTDDEFPPIEELLRSPVEVLDLTGEPKTVGLLESDAQQATPETDNRNQGRESVVHEIDTRCSETDPPQQSCLSKHGGGCANDADTSERSCGHDGGEPVVHVEHASAHGPCPPARPPARPPAHPSNNVPCFLREAGSDATATCLSMDQSDKNIQQQISKDMVGESDVRHHGEVKDPNASGPGEEGTFGISQRGNNRPIAVDGANDTARRVMGLPRDGTSHSPVAREEESGRTESTGLNSDGCSEVTVGEGDGQFGEKTAVNSADLGQDRPATVAADPEMEWEIEGELMGKEVIDGEVHYLVPWKATLVPAYLMKNARGLIRKFEARYGSQQSKCVNGSKIKKRRAGRRLAPRKDEGGNTGRHRGQPHK